MLWLLSRLYQPDRPPTVQKLPWLPSLEGTSGEPISTYKQRKTQL